MGRLNNPHDQFFKIMLSDIDAAKAFIRCFMPPNVVKLLDLATLRITDNTFVNENMSSQFADLVLECALKSDRKSEIFISILIEHKSNPEKYAILQIGQYLIGGYRKQISGKEKPIRLIIPVLYYHGRQDWNPGKIEDMITECPEDMKIFIPDFGYIFKNISLFTDEEIQSFEEHLLIPGLLIQKHYKNLKRLLNLMEVIFSELSQIEDEGN